jgi:hypothetical protein
LETAFSECRKELIKDHLWQRFFDPSKKNPLTDAQIHDMLKFSYQSDIRLFDERYKNIFTMNLYKSSKNWYELILMQALTTIFGKSPARNAIHSITICNLWVRQ